MNQLSLDLMTAEEARKRIFSMATPKHSQLEDPARIMARRMREVVNSRLDLSHIDEPLGAPTRDKYQWMMDLVLWTGILYPSETDEGYTFTTPVLDECHLEKLKVLSKTCQPDRYLRADGQEKWPRTRNGKIPPSASSLTILDALLGPSLIDAAGFLYASGNVIKILDNLLPTASVPVKDAARTMSNILSHYSYHSGYPEIIQTQYGLKDLARVMKRACPEITTEQIVIPDNPAAADPHSDLWQREKFAEIKAIFDAAPQLQSTPRKHGP